MFSHHATRKLSPICKILTYSEDLSFLNPRSHLKSLFGRSNHDALLENEGKIQEGGYEKEFLSINLQVGISRLHYELTSSQTIFKDFK